MNTVNYSVKYESIIAVSARDSNDQRASFVKYIVKIKIISRKGGIFVLVEGNEEKYSVNYSFTI